MPEETTTSSPDLVQPSSEALFREFSRRELQQNAIDLIRIIIPQEFEIGSEDVLGDVRYRFCSLPEDNIILEERLRDIRAKGTDRTDPVVSKYDSLYQRAAEKAGVKPINIMDTMGAMDFFRKVSEGLEGSPDHYGGANGILIYDAKTSKGIKRIEGPEYTFKDLNRRSEALLAIVQLK